MISEKIVVSAPGKIHLSGEHVVVHGKPAVLVSTSKRLYVTIEKNQKSKIKNQNDISKIKNEDKYLGKIIRLVEDKYQNHIENTSVTIDSSIPIGAGMGSSAALAVATIGALTSWLGKPFNAAEINTLAFQAEKAKHGNPSGGDNTIVCFGGLLWYRKELDFLKTFWLLPFKIPRSFSNFVLINTGRIETTGDLVNQVGEMRRKDDQRFILLISQIEEITRSMTQAIHDENEAEFRECIRDNQRLLEKLGVVSHTSKRLIHEIEKNGGVAKISGAGGIKRGSGIILGLHDNPQQIMKVAQKHEFPAFQVALAGEGVKIEQAIV